MKFYRFTGTSSLSMLRPFPNISQHARNQMGNMIEIKSIKLVERIAAYNLNVLSTALLFKSQMLISFHFLV